MGAHKSVTSCEAVLYVDDVQWNYNNNVRWQFGPVKLHDIWLNPSSNYLGLNNISLGCKPYTMPFICHVRPGPVHQGLFQVYVWCDEGMCCFAVVAIQVEISKCITVTLVLPGEVRHNPLCCRLLHIKDVFEDVGHQYMALHHPQSPCTFVMHAGFYHHRVLDTAKCRLHQVISSVAWL